MRTVLPRKSIAGASLAVLLSFASGPGCIAPSTDAGKQVAPLQFDARVMHVPLEGGFFGLVADDGTRYEPLELAPRFHHEGLRLRVRAEVVDVASIRMWGRPIRILEAEPLR